VEISTHVPCAIGRGKKKAGEQKDTTQRVFLAGPPSPSSRGRCSEYLKGGIVAAVTELRARKSEERTAGA